MAEAVSFPLFFPNYWGVVLERRIPQEQIDALCGSGKLACTTKPVCHWHLSTAVTIPKDLQRIRAHELLHCRGKSPD